MGVTGLLGKYFTLSHITQEDRLAFLFPLPQCGAFASERAKIFVMAIPNAK